MEPIGGGVAIFINDENQTLKIADNLNADLSYKIKEISKLLVKDKKKFIFSTEIVRYSLGNCA